MTDHDAARIFGKLEELALGQIELKSSVKSMESRMETVEDAVGKLDEWQRGTNGNTGFSEELRSLKARVTGFEKAASDAREQEAKTRELWQRPLVHSVVSAVVTGLIMLVGMGLLVAVNRSIDAAPAAATATATE